VALTGRLLRRRARHGPVLAPLSVKACVGNGRIDIEKRAGRMVAATGDRACRASTGEAGRRVDVDANHRAS